VPAVRAIEAVATSIAAFVGRTETGQADTPITIGSLADYERQFGDAGASRSLASAVRGFFQNGGRQALVVRLQKSSSSAGSDEPLDAASYLGSRTDQSGLYALDKADLFNLLCIPPDIRDGDVRPEVYQAALAYCAERRAMLIVDAPAAWSAGPDTAAVVQRLEALGLTGAAARNAAIYFPRVRQAGPLTAGRHETFAPCGHIAGVFARTDATRGVWKAPAGLDAHLEGIDGLAAPLDDAGTALLNPLGINCLRAFPASGRVVVWGSRTMRGANVFADEYKYVPVRRTALFIEETVYRGIAWARSEPNGEPLWAELRRSVGEFMHTLFRQGAFSGSSPRDAYFVRCDSATTTQADVDAGVLNLQIGFAPLKPAEFVVIRVQHVMQGGDPVTPP
jgi:phage tail sheath protein FI